MEDNTACPGHTRGTAVAWVTLGVAFTAAGAGAQCIPLLPGSSLESCAALSPPAWERLWVCHCVLPIACFQAPQRTYCGTAINTGLATSPALALPSRAGPPRRAQHIPSFLCVAARGALECPGVSSSHSRALLEGARNSLWDPPWGLGAGEERAGLWLCGGRWRPLRGRAWGRMGRWEEPAASVCGGTCWMDGKTRRTQQPPLGVGLAAGATPGAAFPFSSTAAFLEVSRAPETPGRIQDRGNQPSDPLSGHHGSNLSVTTITTTSPKQDPPVAPEGTTQKSTPLTSSDTRTAPDQDKGDVTTAASHTTGTSAAPGQGPSTGPPGSAGEQDSDSITGPGATGVVQDMGSSSHGPPVTTAEPRASSSPGGVQSPAATPDGSSPSTTPGLTTMMPAASSPQMIPRPVDAASPSQPASVTSPSAPATDTLEPLGSSSKRPDPLTTVSSGPGTTAGPGHTVPSPALPSTPPPQDPSQGTPQTPSQMPASPATAATTPSEATQPPSSGPGSVATPSVQRPMTSPSEEVSMVPEGPNTPSPTSAPANNWTQCESAEKLSEKLLVLNLTKASLCGDSPPDEKLVTLICRAVKSTFNPARDQCRIQLTYVVGSQAVAIKEITVTTNLLPTDVYERLKDKWDDLQAEGVSHMQLGNQGPPETTEDRFSTPLIITIVCMASFLLLVAALYGCCHQRLSQRKDQQRLTEELQTVENGYHDNPTLEVMETSSEMQEKKAVGLNGELGDSWIVPLDNLTKDDLEEEEDTHL
ncbi:podocalyxin [Carlito syrichta]|uniref:Podocalyxin n=1 Tax=Carlito syrichta TaxID=1868482 RepID=A0A3Q0DJV0_CARSF|nr:podocalyxin [Carlito syrichta]